ncbi:hypothetical protein [Paramaledivibacter caminithermalis]|jgi:hypothetical protein|uniref:Hook-length control protein FliK n=1 Tax=Paramaledivibacter caminithermalis (strain DSM 15212 / CIP 107654 / DViRD3) TaxID=1121301 RepID=A0A1M6NK25_PARC5|nr:hypothetical protein [Paramaledivibacter caminithermalis]SHJ96101.1 hypothetical protein SAMN02745912_01764 [Paramaledivibacter caminithermalis DSM 15212]
MEIQNLINSIYNSNTNINNDLLSRLNIGDTLKAKVIAIVGDLITLEINNNFTVEAKDISAINYNIGEMIEFIVNDKVDGKLFIKSNISRLNSLEDRLLQMGIKINEDNKELINLLYKNQVPITKENIETILSTKKYYGKLIDYINDFNNNDLPIDSKIVNDDIKEVLRYLIQKDYEALTYKTSYKNEESKNLTDIIKLSNNDSFNNSFAKDFLNSNNISLEKLVFMMKNNLNFNAKNVVLLNNIILGEKTITNQIQNLIMELEQNEVILESADKLTTKANAEKNTEAAINHDVIDENKEIKAKTKDQLLEALHKFDITNIREKEKLNSIMKELFETLDSIKNAGLGKETNSIINKYFEEIKSSLDFVNKLNDNISFIQIPLNMNNSLKNLDIYVNKDSKKSKNRNKKNTKIFISLNTNNLDLVQVLIEINKKDINLNFRVCNDKIKNIMKSNEEMLLNSLKKYEFNNIIFKYSVSTERINLMNIESNNHQVKLNTLDIRV